MVEIISKGFLVFYVIIAFGASLFLWINIDSPDSLKNIGILFSSVLPVAISVLPYLNTVTIERQYTYRLFFDNTIGGLVLGDDRSAYSLAYLRVFSNIPRNKGGQTMPSPSSQMETAYALDANNPGDFLSQRGLDIIERAVLEELMLKFGLSWDKNQQTIKIKIINNTTIVPTSGFSGEFIDLPHIRTLFRHNKIISNPQTLASFGIVLPPRTKISPKFGQGPRELVISNRYASIKIIMSPYSSEVLPHGVLDILPDDSQNMAKYYYLDFHVSIFVKFARLQNFSHKMKVYRLWVDNLISALGQCDWDKISEETDKKLFRQATSVILQRH